MAGALTLCPPEAHLGISRAGPAPTGPPARIHIHPLPKFCLLLLALTAVSDADETGESPWLTSALNVESGLLWQIGTGTPFDYRLVPTQLSWRSAEFWGRGFADGSRVVLRHRLTLIGTLVQNGPESHYAGFSGSTSHESWDNTGTWSHFTGAGGGLVWID